METLQRWACGGWVFWALLAAGCAPGSGALRATANDSALAATPPSGASTETPLAPALPLSEPASVALAPSSGCSAAPMIRASKPWSRELIQVSGSTAAAASTSQSPWGGCDGATSGPDAWYVLDLQALPAPVELHAVVDADFDAALDLRRGPCEDTLSLDCDRAAALGRPQSALSLRLAAGVYWLVVDGKDEASHGDFRLQVELDPGAAGASPSPTNDSCERPQPFAGLELETLFVHPNVTDGATTSYYSLDLSAETAPVVATLSAWNLAAEHLPKAISIYHAGAADPPCGSLVASDFLRSESSQGSDVELSTRLDPGRYTFEVVQQPLTSATDVSTTGALTLRLDRELCRAGPVANSCETAIEIDTAPGAHVVEGSTLCNSDHLSLGYCNEASSPDQFYRLDLSAESAPTRTRLTVLLDGLGLQPLLYVLGDGGSGACGRGLYCFDTVQNFEGLPHYDLTLQPGLYFIGVESVSESAGRYRLLVELDRAEPSPCVTSAIDECVERNSLAYCCDGWDLPECPELISLCGLAVETQRCVCEREPACCGAPGDTSRCAEAYSACNYLCPEFAPSTSQCLDPHR